MYKLLLCWRYLRTRYIALASIISVMLGVATMIVVNSVMEGFTSEMENRIHGILSDVVVESRSFDGMPDAGLEDQIRAVAGDEIEAMSPTVVSPAVLSFEYGTRPVQLIGIDEKRQGLVSDFGDYLQHPANRKTMSFQLRHGSYDTRDRRAGADARPRPQMASAGWEHRRKIAKAQKFQQRLLKTKDGETKPAENASQDPFAQSQPAERVFDPAAVYKKS